jgi:hypothetical protein
VVTTPDWRRVVTVLIPYPGTVVTFGNNCLEGKLTFGDTFLESGVVRQTCGEGRPRWPHAAERGSILNVGLLNLVPVTGRFGHVAGGIPPDT